MIFTYYKYKWYNDKTSNALKMEKNKKGYLAENITWSLLCIHERHFFFPVLHCVYRPNIDGLYTF